LALDFAIPLPIPDITQDNQIAYAEPVSGVATASGEGMANPT